MYLTRLKVQAFRNFNKLDIEPGQHFNFIYGDNGSGKTSILEAIHFLSLGRSFRSHLVNRIIQYHSPALTVFGTVFSPTADNHFNIGIEKGREGKLRLRIANETAHSASQLAKLLPLQLLNPDSYSLLTEGPRPRREFLDWGVFHVEPLFFDVWQRFQKALAQRNAALQQNVPFRQVKVWDMELVPAAIELSRLREGYFQHLVPMVRQVLAGLIAIADFSIDYKPGWDVNEALELILESSYLRDKALGYTQYGPQRADIIFKVSNVPAQDSLSRGEQKLLVCALRLAQGILLRELTGKICIYLLDDLAAELDPHHRECVINALAGLNAQVFITAVERKISDLLKNYSCKMFHVEHGKCVA